MSANPETLLDLDAYTCNAPLLADGTPRTASATFRPAGRDNEAGVLLRVRTGNSEVTHQITQHEARLLAYQMLKAADDMALEQIRASKYGVARQ